jgi:hypothetical protein
MACEKNMEKTSLYQGKNPHNYIVLQELKNIMYDKDSPYGASVEMWAMHMLQYITSKYPATNVFWKYMEENW